jgi:uncharacterized membrane protein YhaH (DUF805 family)
MVRWSPQPTTTEADTMSFGAAIRSVLGQYATFSGRARRSEYWWWVLAHTLVGLALYVVALGLLFSAPR